MLQIYKNKANNAIQKTTQPIVSNPKMPNLKQLQMKLQNMVDNMNKEKQGDMAMEETLKSSEEVVEIEYNGIVLSNEELKTNLDKINVYMQQLETDLKQKKEGYNKSPTVKYSGIWLNG